MTAFPDFAAATIDPRKLTAYLLSETNPKGRDKARFFRAFGFHPDQAPLFARALIAQAVNGHCTGTELMEHGTKYVIVGRIETPDRRAPMIRTIWLVAPGGTTPRLVTAYPED